MKAWNIFTGIGLAVTLVLGLNAGAQAALVNSPKQLIMMQGNSGADHSGILYFTKLSIVKSDGTTVPLPESIPPRQDVNIVITWIQLGFTPDDKNLIANVDLQMGPFFSMPRILNNGWAGFTEGFDPGLVINLQGVTDPRIITLYRQPGR